VLYLHHIAFKISKAPYKEYKHTYVVYILRLPSAIFRKMVEIFSEFLSLSYIFY